MTSLIILILGCQTCVNNPSVNQRGEVTVSRGRQVIVPTARFNCNGRITNVAVSMQLILFGTNLPLFQVWHPASLNSSIYSKISELELPSGDHNGGIIINYYSANVSLNSSSQIEFQSGDVIGYYQPSDPRRLIYSIQTSGYSSYSNTAATPLTSIDTNNIETIDIDYQPLIEVTFGEIIIHMYISMIVICMGLYALKNCAKLLPIML